MTTVRLTAAQALFRYLSRQMNEDGVPFLAGAWAIFGHGNVAGLGQALLEAGEETDAGYRVAGRMSARRGHGGAAFIDVVDRSGKLALASKPNQDTPLMDGQRVLMGNDVWEHAYYLKYQNRRPDYLKAWWNVLDWGKIGARYAAAKAGTITI